MVNLTEATLEVYDQKQKLKSEILELEASIKQASQMIMSKDLVNMERVLRRLDLIDKHNVPMLKGKVAACISAADELLTTELLFSGFFQELDSVQIAAVLSCLVHSDNKSEGEPPKDDSLSKPFLELQRIAG